MTDTERSELLERVRELSRAAAETSRLFGHQQALLKEAQEAIEGAKLVISLLCEQVVKLEAERTARHFDRFGAKA